MIDNFEEVKNQLRELADVINKFTSEAVQLRIVELVLGGTSHASPTDADSSKDELEVPSPRRRAKKRTKLSGASSDVAKKKPSPAGQGPVSTLANLATGDFFDSPQSIKSIIEHCEVNLARKIKQTDISGKLARLVREGVLKRAKNSDGQYEYSKK